MTTMFDDLMTGLEEVDAFLAGQTAGYRVSLPAEVDVKSIRKGLKMTQSRFSDTFGFSLDAVKHWEGGRRTPDSSARAFLTVIARNPGAVIEALHPQLPPSRHAVAAQETRTETTSKWAPSHLKRSPEKRGVRLSGIGSSGELRIAK
jgi:putative transcriptional regulator